MPPFCDRCRTCHTDSCADYAYRLAYGESPNLYGQSLIDMVVERAEVDFLERMWSLPAREMGR